MIRSAAGKVAWMARATTTVVGVAIMLALVFGVASTAMSATGGNFILGKANAADRVSKLTASVAGPALTLVNQSTEAAATALNISVAEGKAPIKVNAAAGTATGLSADELDGKSSAQFADGVGGKATDADKLDGKDSSEFLGKTEKAIDAEKLDGKDASQLGGPGRSGVSNSCDPLSDAQYVTCASVDLTLPSAGRVLLIAEGQWRQQTGTADGRCRFGDAGTSNDQVELGGGPAAGSLGLTEVTGSVGAGTHRFRIECREFGGNTFMFSDMEMSAVYVGDS